MKKLCIVGRGTAGCLSIGHFLKYTDWEIDWIFDEDIPPQAVGEGADLKFVGMMTDYFNIRFNDIEKLFNGTPKLGIKKYNWGTKNKEYMHHFFPLGNHSLHFTATKLQDFVINFASKNKRVNIIHKNVTDLENLDADHVLSCAGKPSNYDDYHVTEYIPVNAVHVTQCFWDGPRFPYTLTIARPYGWVFGIPLTNRCSIGYMYNHNINTIDEIKKDVQEVFEQFNLTPSDTTNSFKFKNYYHKNPIGTKVSYNGNASFFLEPLEATSISFMDTSYRLCFDYWHGIESLEKVNAAYARKIDEIEAMIMMHYYAGSTFKSDFWKFAQEKGTEKISKFFNDPQFKLISNSAMKLSTFSNPNDPEAKSLRQSFATWGTLSFLENYDGLGIKEKMLMNVFQHTNMV